MDAQTVLTDAPLPPAAVDAVVPLYSLSQEMGSTSPRKIPEGDLTIGKWHITALKPTTGRATIDRAKWDLYLLELPFTLHALPEDTFYKRVKFRISLAPEQNATAYSLYPADVTTTMEERVKVGVSVEGKLSVEKVGEAGATAGYEKQYTFSRLLPIISSFGVGEPTFYWLYDSPEKQWVAPGTKYALAIVEVPKNTRMLHGTIQFEVMLFRKFLGPIGEKDTFTDVLPRVWTLRSTK